MKISNDNKILTHITKLGWSTCYGKTIISSLINKIYIWKFKILFGDGDFINIGIDNSVAKWIDDTIYDKKKKASYIYSWALYSWNNIVKTEFPKFKYKNDILTMKLIFDD